MSDRYIEVGEKKWKTLTESVRWSYSAKGNLFTTYRNQIIVIVQRNFKRGADDSPGKWQFMITRASDNSMWEVHGKFETPEEAQKASLEFVRTPTSERKKSSEVAAAPELTEIQTSVRRKIVLGEQT